MIKIDGKDDFRVFVHESNVRRSRIVLKTSEKEKKRYGKRKFIIKKKIKYNNNMNIVVANFSIKRKTRAGEPYCKSSVSSGFKTSTMLNIVLYETNFSRYTNNLGGDFIPLTYFL